jgi:7 transmembrane receptor (rhodopsin family)
MESAVESIYAADSTLLFTPGEMVSMSIMLVISIFGLIGTITVLYSSIFYHQSPHRMIIISLSVADCLICINGFLAAAGNLGRGKILSGQWGLTKCMIESFLALISILISIISLTTIAVERYFAVFYGFRDHTRPVIIAIALAWIYAIGYASTSLGSGDNFRLLSTRTTCIPRCSNSTMFPLCLFGGAFLFISIQIAGLCYFKLYMFYRESNRKREVVGSKEDGTEKKEKILLRKFTIIVLSFAVATMPFFIGFVYEAVSGNLVPSVIAHLSLVLLMINSAMNPYLFYALDQSIKQQVDDVFGVNIAFAKIFTSERQTSSIQSPISPGQRMLLDSRNGHYHKSTIKGQNEKATVIIDRD